MILFLREDFERAWPDPFQAVQQVRGEVFRDKERCSKKAKMAF